jgi:hypothetical protein
VYIASLIREPVDPVETTTLDRKNTPRVTKLATVYTINMYNPVMYAQSFANDDITYITIIAVSGRKIATSGVLHAESANVNNHTSGNDRRVAMIARLPDCPAIIPDV